MTRGDDVSWKNVAIFFLIAIRKVRGALLNWRARNTTMARQKPQILQPVAEVFDIGEGSPES